jgi:hypothetical protein
MEFESQAVPQTVRERQAEILWALHEHLSDVHDELDGTAVARAVQCHTPALRGSLGLHLACLRDNVARAAEGVS